MTLSLTIRRTAYAFALTLACALTAHPAHAKKKAKPPVTTPAAAATPSPAAEPAPSAAEVEEKLEDLPNPDKSCKKDVAAFCATVKPGNNQLAACLRTHKDELADSCKKALYDYLKKRFEQACKPDVKKFCQKESTQQGGLMPCLQRHGEHLSAGCQEMIGIKKAAAPAAAPAK